jgi:diketogulonate reductase-like aldo/keto reductase
MYGTAWKKERTTDCVVRAVKAGFRAIDTANQPKHYSEPLVGEALLQLKKKGIDRKDLFLQTKFTPIDGQGTEIPYDPDADYATQVEQSFQSSLEHLQTDFLDSYLLHGPYTYPGLSNADFEVWETMEKIYKSGKTKAIGISNVILGQLELLTKNANVKPMVVQNRCYASRLWDKEVREFCKANGVIYQGFSLLTANVPILHDLRIQKIAERVKLSPMQVIFVFARQIGMLPLTGTTNDQHMKDDLETSKFELTSDEVAFIETVGIG